jgi:hypothetical protein
MEMMLRRIHEDRIVRAAAIAEQLSVSGPTEEVRLNAFRVVSELSPDAGKRLMAELAKSDRPTTSQVLLVRMVAGLKDSAPNLEALAKGTGLSAALARLALARVAMDASTTKAAADLAAFGHPFVLEHLLGAIREDLSKAPDKADVYTPVLLDLLRKTPDGASPSEIASQDVSARAATLLGDIGSPNSLAGLKEVLAGPYGEPKRAATFGLVRTKNNAASDLVKPLLDSPYPELSVTAAVCLARHNNKEGLRGMRDVLLNLTRYRSDRAAMTCWYALKLSNEHAAVLQELIKNAK